jgi:uncharacterized protein YbjT (DUF2867 family)
VKRVLVVGSTGYLGRLVVSELKSRGYWVRALVRRASAFDDTETPPDEIIVGEATKPESLANLCEGIDFVFSSLGITRQRDNVGFWDVDYQANRNILDIAAVHQVKKFVIVSVVNQQITKHLDIVAAREAFINELKADGTPYSILRATGFFSDIAEFLSMAKSGRVFVIGSGNHRVNPIHGADLAAKAVDAFTQEQTEVLAGGPDTLTYNQIATLAFSTLKKPPKIYHIPGTLVSAILALIRIFSRKTYTTLKFLTTVMQNDMVAPATGTHPLKEFFEEKANDT